LYDSNRISIEGSTGLAFDEDVAGRFTAYGWNVLQVPDVNDRERLQAQYDAAKREASRPTLIIAKSEIGYGSPHKQGKASAHGEPLGADEVKLTKKAYGWPEDASFLVPPGVLEHFSEGMVARGKALRDDRFEAYGRKFPELAREVRQMQARELPEGWDRDLPPFTSKEIGEKGMATREASGKVLNLFAQRIPWLLGGSADLAPSTKTRLTFEGAGDFSAQDHGGRNFHFGVREHAMGAFINGMSLSKLRPYGSTFLIFSDYVRPAIRLGAIMEIPVLYIFTHDSIGVGEDGPTHQPVEHLASLRAIPGLITIRPADANEVLEAWKVILSLKHEPCALILTRQNLPLIDRERYAPASGVSRGAYVIAGSPSEKPEVILIATGSEVSLCLEAHAELANRGVKARVVSMPSWELFERQGEEYRESVLPAAVTNRVSVEQAATFGWERWVGEKGTRIGMRTFGASAPLKVLLKKFGFTKESVVEAALAQVGKGA
jgi:transketolase